MPKSPDEVKGLLVAAYSKNVLSASPGPYHFIASFQTFALDGTPAGDGTIERWASAAPGRIKTVTRFGGHTMTDFDDHGKHLYTDDGFVGSIMSYYVRIFFDYPTLPPAGVKRNVQTTAMSMQGAVLDCGMFQAWIEPPDYPPMPKDGFCVSRDSGNLALRQTQRFSIRYQDHAPFLDQAIARRITASKGSHVRCRIKIDQLDQAVLDDVAMTLPPDASPTSPAPDIWATKATETVPAKTGKVPIPPALKAAHANGLVEVFILISRTGTVIDAEPFFSLSPELEDMGLQTVKTWTYKPILRDGKPLEVIAIARLPLQF